MHKLRSVLAFAMMLLWVQVGLAAVPDSVLMDRSMIERNGIFQSVDLERKRLMISDSVYVIGKHFDIVQHSKDGMRRIDPAQVAPGVRVGIEKRDGAVVRLHIMD